MRDFSDNALRTKMQGGHLKPVVAAILKHHAMASVALGRINDTPAIGYRIRNRHFAGHVFAVLHGINRNIGMPSDTGADINKVDVIAPTHRFPVVGTAIFIGQRLVVRLQNC